MNTDFFYGRLGIFYDFVSKITRHWNFSKQFIKQSDFNLRNGDWVFDSGCGSGRLIVPLLEEYRLEREIKIRGFAVDKNPKILALCERNAQKAGVNQYLTLYEGDARNLKYLKPFKSPNGKVISLEDDRFKLVMSSGLIECITENPKYAAHELERVLQEQGTCVFSVVKRNPIGISAGALVRFKTRKTADMLDLFNYITFEKANFKSWNWYMKSFKQIYKGTKPAKIKDYVSIMSE